MYSVTTGCFLELLVVAAPHLTVYAAKGLSPLDGHPVWLHSNDLLGVEQQTVPHCAVVSPHLQQQ